MASATPDLRLPSQPQRASSPIGRCPVPNYTASDRDMGVNINNLPRACLPVSPFPLFAVSRFLGVIGLELELGLGLRLGLELGFRDRVGGYG